MANVTRGIHTLDQYVEYFRESALINEERHDLGRERIVWAIEKYEKDTDLIIRGRDLRKRELQQKLRMYDDGAKPDMKRLVGEAVRERLNSKKQQLQ
jgi:hypothetical protein